MKESKKVLCLCQVPGPVHGSSIMGRTVLKVLTDAEQIDVDFIDIGLSNEVKKINRFELRKAVVFFKIVRKLLVSLHTSSYDTIYFAATLTRGGLIKDTILRLLIRFRSNTRVIIHSHNKIPPKLKLYEQLLIPLLLKGSDLAVLSKRLDFSKYFKYIERTFVLPNGVEEISQNCYKRTGTPRVRFLFLSNFIESKGVLKALEAFIYYKQTLNGIGEIQFFGNDGDVSRATIIDHALKGNVTKDVTVLGPIYGEEKYEVLRHSDVFIFPSKYPMEVLPLSLIEAAMFGLPIISYDNGAIGDIVNDNNGFLLPYDSTIEQIARCMLSMENEDIRNSLAAHSKIIYNHCFTMDKFKNNLLNII